MYTQSDSMDQFLRDFRGTLEDAASRMMRLSAEQSSSSTGPDKWTPKEILGHLIDSAANNHQRFVRAQFTDDLIFPGYMQDEWVAVQRYNDEPWPELVQLWRSYNFHLLHVISVMPEKTLFQSRSKHNLDQIAWKRVDKSQPTTLEYFVRDYVGHLKHHLSQIFGEDDIRDSAN
jgi:DinB superfamily